MNHGRGRRTGEAGARTRCPQRPRVLALSLLAVLAGAADEAPPRVIVPETQPASDAPPARSDLGDGAAVRLQAGEAELGAACDDAAFLLAAGRAREALARLEAVAHAARPDHPAQSRATTLLTAARAAEARSDVSGAESDRLAAAEAARQRALQGAVAAASLRAERLARARDLHARGHRELALANLRALLHDLPGDEEVEALFRSVLEETFTLRSAAIAERERELRSELSLRVERALIPEGHDGRPMFPADWDQRRAGRRAMFDVEDTVPAWQQAIADRLAARVTIGFDATPLNEAIDIVCRLGGINIVASPELLAATDRLITLRAVGMRLDDVLAWIAEQAGTRWSLTNGAVFLGDEVSSAVTVAIHDLGELLAGTGDFPGVRLDLSTGGAGGTPAGFLAATEEGTPPATADDVADLIKRSVSPRAWLDPANTIVVRGNALLVTAPGEVQRLIREFLRAQSAQRSLSVRVDARWLELTDRYVEEIGVQWTSGPSQLIDPGAGARGGYVRQLDGWSFEGSSRNQLPGTSMSIQPALAGTGMTLQGALISGTKLSAVLSAVHRNAQGRNLRSPELCCLNGQQANAFFGGQIAYISDYEIVGGNYDPVISVLSIGTMLEVRPLVSADRKFVTLELRSATTNASLFTEYIVAYDINSRSTASYPIELPNVAIRTVGTSVMLPDRGSLLVGGFTASLDQFASTRVPLLGSIPFLGRLFGARGRYSDKSKLYLLTTATIINYPELEARL